MFLPMANLETRLSLHSTLFLASKSLQIFSYKLKRKNSLVFCIRLTEYFTSDTECVGFAHISTNSLPPHRCPTAQFYSDATNLELLRTPQVKGSVLTAPLKTLITSKGSLGYLITSRGLSSYPHFCPTCLQIRDSCDPFHGFDDLLEWLPELTETLTFTSLS